MTRLVIVAVAVLLAKVSCELAGSVEEQNKVLIEELQRKQRADQDRIDKLEAKLDLLANSKTSCSCTENKRDLRQLQAQSETGFLATVSVDKQSLHVGDTIKFDHVITNINNAYNPQTGVFTCPTSGTYLFNMNVMSASSNYVEATITVNGAHQVNALSDHQSTGTSWDQGSTAAILRLTEGDEVAVQILYPPGENTLHGNSYTTFSGYLLRSLQ